jgi:hypothetical protein
MIFFYRLFSRMPLLHLCVTVYYLKFVLSTSMSHYVFAVDEVNSFQRYKGDICTSPFASQFPSSQYKPHKPNSFTPLH